MHRFICIEKRGKMRRGGSFYSYENFSFPTEMTRSITWSSSRILRLFIVTRFLGIELDLLPQRLRRLAIELLIKRESLLKCEISKRERNAKRNHEGDKSQKCIADVCCAQRRWKFHATSGRGGFSERRRFFNVVEFGNVARMSFSCFASAILIKKKDKESTNSLEGSQLCNVINSISNLKQKTFIFKFSMKRNHCNLARREWKKKA